MTDVSLQAQIAEVEREIAMREMVYPGQVRSHKMRQSVADLHVSRMKAVLKTLQFLERNRGEFLEMVRVRKETEERAGVVD